MMRNLPRIGLALLVVVGLFCRFFDLGQKPYWYDETYTVLRLSGHTVQEIRQQLGGRIVGVETLKAYLQTAPQSTIFETGRSLALEEPQHLSLYFFLAHFWTKWFGNSVATLRTLSVMLSLLAFPFLYWLSRELFDTPAVAWTAVLLMAISPFHLIYAQEAREYGLWTMTTLFTCAALLRALRLNTVASWAVYALALVLSFYSFLLTFLVVVGQAIYVLFRSKRKRETVVTFTIAVVMSFILSAPLFWVVLNNLPAITAATAPQAVRVSYFALLQGWISSSLEFLISFPPSNGGILRILRVALIAVELYALFFLSRRLPEQAAFLLTIAAANVLLLVLPDLLAGGSRVTIGRYLIPSLLAYGLATAYLLVEQSRSANALNRIAWQAVGIGLIAISLSSTILISQVGKIREPKEKTKQSQIAESLAPVHRPLLVAYQSETTIHGFGNLAGLLYALPPTTDLLLVVEPGVPRFDRALASIFLLDPLEQLRAQLLEQGILARPLRSGIWSLAPIEKVDAR